MIHYSCDRCKRVLRPDEEQRFVVYVEIYPELDPPHSQEIEDDRDHLLEIHEILERSEPPDCGPSDPFAKTRYDLCSACYKDYIQNPVGRDVPIQVEFSDN